MAELPSRNLLGQTRAGGTLDTSTRFTSVGYRVQETGAQPDRREFSVGAFSSLTPALLRLSQNAARGHGGTCHGDSGGPSFLGAGAGETRTIAGVTMTGDPHCRATNVTQRVDTDTARAFRGGSWRCPRAGGGRELSLSAASQFGATAALSAATDGIEAGRTSAFGGSGSRAVLRGPTI